MKKFYSLLAILFVGAAAAFAQSEVMLCDKDGNTYANGAELTIKGSEVVVPPSELDPEGYSYLYMPSPYIINKGTASAKVYFEINVKTLPAHTGFQYCWDENMNCRNQMTTGKLTTNANTLPAGTVAATECEWQNGDVYGSCTTEWTIYVNGAKGNSYTVTYIMEKESGIQSATIEGGEDTIYTLDGRRASRAAQQSKGLFVKNGKKMILR